MDSVYYTTAGLAKASGLCMRTIYSHARKGWLKGERLSNRMGWRFSHAAVDAWAAFFLPEEVRGRLLEGPDRASVPPGPNKRCGSGDEECGMGGFCVGKGRDFQQAAAEPPFVPEGAPKTAAAFPSQTGGLMPDPSSHGSEAQQQVLMQASTPAHVAPPREEQSPVRPAPRWCRSGQHRAAHLILDGKGPWGRCNARLGACGAWEPVAEGEVLTSLEKCNACKSNERLWLRNGGAT